MGFLWEDDSHETELDSEELCMAVEENTKNGSGLACSSTISFCPTPNTKHRNKRMSKESEAFKR